MSMIRDLFKESPFEPLRYHMKSVMECVAFVKPMFEAVRDGQHDKLQEIARKVFKAEHQADIIKNDIRRTIPKRFFLPVYRGDLLGYIKLQDDMADSVEDIAVLLTIKKLPLPAPLAAPTFEYIDKVDEVCRQTCAISDRSIVAVLRMIERRVHELGERNGTGGEDAFGKKPHEPGVAALTFGWCGHGG